MSSRTLLLGVFTIILTISLPAGQTVAQSPLPQRWNQGEQLTYVIEDDYTSESTVTSDFFELDQKLILDSMWHVKNVSSKGEAEIVVTIERVRFMADGKGAAAMVEKIQFDSDDEKEPASKPEQGVSNALKAFVGSPIAVTIDERGDIAKYEMSEALAAVMKDGATRELAGFFGDIFTEHGLRHRLTHWLVEFPKKPLANGDTWRQEQPSRLGEPFLAVHSYTYAGPVSREGRTVHQINVEPELKRRTIAADKRPGRLAEQNGEGVVHFDDRTGRIVEVVLKHHAVLEAYARTTLDTKTTVKLRPEPNK